MRRTSNGSLSPRLCSYECALVSCWDELDDKRAERLLDGKGLADYRKERQAVADTLAKIGCLAPIMESYPFPCWNCGHLAGSGGR